MSKIIGHCSTQESEVSGPAGGIVVKAFDFYMADYGSSPRPSNLKLMPGACASVP